MAKENVNTDFNLMHPICAGLDIHRKKISATIAITDSEGKIEYHIKEFNTITPQLEKMRNWLDEFNCPIVAMESTGIYWRPVHNILEDHVAVVLVNAKHIKNVPGRKTDINDSRWLAELLRCGLLRGSFIPDKEIRHWKDLVILRKTFKKNANDYKRRTHKLFETANIKIGTVLTDIFGKTGRNLIDRLLDPNSELTKKDVAACAKGSLKKKVPEIYRSIQGFFEDHHRYQLQMLIDTIDDLESKVDQLSKHISELMQSQEQLIMSLDEIPGVDILAAQSIIAHVGYDLNAFEKMHNFISWAGLCPGNNESAGKRKSGKSPVHKHHFKTLLVEVAWAAIRKKGTFYRAKYFSLKARIGPQKSAVAIAHKIAMAIYYMIKRGDSYKELGEGHLKAKNKEKKMKYLEKQAKALGFTLVAA